MVTVLQAVCKRVSKKRGEEMSVTTTKNVTIREPKDAKIVISDLTPEQSQALDQIVYETNKIIRSLNRKIKRLEKQVTTVTASRDWYKDAYETVTGGTNPL
jgi:hypothetical protein